MQNFGEFFSRDLPEYTWPWGYAQIQAISIVYLEVVKPTVGRRKKNPPSENVPLFRGTQYARTRVTWINDGTNKRRNQLKCPKID